MTTQHDSPSELSTLVGGLLTVGALFLATVAALISVWLAPVAGIALLALGWFGWRTRAPRVLVIATFAFAFVLLGLAALAFLPA